MLVEGTSAAKILVVYDRPCVNALAENKVIFGLKRDLLLNQFARAGVLETDLMLVRKSKGESSAEFLEQLKHTLSTGCFNVLVPVGEEPLALLTGLKGIFDWHCSIIPATAELGGRKCVPLLSVEYAFRSYGDSAYLIFGAARIAQEMHSPEINIPKRTFHLDPSPGFTLGFLHMIKPGQTIAVDLETGRGMINTVGIALSSTEAIAIKTVQSDYTPEEWHKLWLAIAAVMENPEIKKVAQNGIFELLYLSRYGIRFEGMIHDTMWAMKFLYPELEKGLHNVGRIFTRFPYWKKDSDDWNNIQHWDKHLEYNAKDTTGTFEGYVNQLQALKQRGLEQTFQNLVMQFFEPLAEMCSNGMLLNEEKLLSMKNDTMRAIAEHEEYVNRRIVEACGEPININSPSQLKRALKGLGYALPLKKDKDGDSKESSDKKALVKLRRKYPDEPLFGTLIERSKLQKLFSSYLNFGYDQRTKKIHYMLDGCGTETGRWCLRKGSKIALLGKEVKVENVQVDDLAYCYDKHGNLQLKKVLWSGKTGHKKLIRLHWSAQSGRKGFLDLTPEHQVRLVSGKYVKASELNIGDRTLSLRRHEDSGYMTLIGANKKIREHVFAFQSHHGFRPEIVHHKDHNPLNNELTNLEGMCRKEHTRLHAQEAGRKPPKQPTYEQRSRGSSVGTSILTEEQVWEIKALLAEEKYKDGEIGIKFGVSKGCVASIRRGSNWKHVVYNNHIITKIEDLDLSDDVYDLEIEDCHNFIANEICVHNSGSNDHINNGFNPQTVPKKIRGLVRAAEGKRLIEIDLSQAESRFVAWESPEPKLMEMILEGRDIHKYVGAKIFRKPEEFVTPNERQLGKKSGHSANYGVGPRTFAEACLTEMNIYIEEREAKRIIQGYYEIFPGIYKRQAHIQKQVRTQRMMKTPLGRERQFFGRVDDSMFREAYAYAPQSTIPDIMNALLAFLFKNFENIDFLLQVHDSLLLQVDQGREGEIAEAARDYAAWHPEIVLPGGKLIIPVEVECGNYWKPMEKI